MDAIKKVTTELESKEPVQRRSRKRARPGIGPLDRVDCVPKTQVQEKSRMDGFFQVEAKRSIGQGKKSVGDQDINLQF